MKIKASPNENEKKYVTIKKEAHAELEERKSIFIGHAKPVTAESEAVEFIKAMKNEYSDATHNVYAYYMRGGALARCNDDGEPQGTAGVPVLNVLKMSGADDLCVVVTRYFGGILLGAGGLVRAYSAAAKLALDKAEIAVFVPFSELTMRCSYSDYARIENEIPRIGASIDGVSFDESVTIHVSIDEKLSEIFISKITEMSGGRVIPKITGSKMAPKN